MCERYYGQKALLVDVTNAGIPVRYSPAGDVGADRIVNAVAAWHKYGQPSGVPLIVVDFGTATTFDIISVKGEYLGGVICPGIGISAEALFQRAARLPRVEVRRAACGDRAEHRQCDAVRSVFRLRGNGGRLGSADPR